MIFHIVRNISNINNHFFVFNIWLVRTDGLTVFFTLLMLIFVMKSHVVLLSNVCIFIEKSSNVYKQQPFLVILIPPWSLYSWPVRLMWRHIRLSWYSYWDRNSWRYKSWNSKCKWSFNKSSKIKQYLEKCDHNCFCMF